MRSGGGASAGGSAAGRSAPRHQGLAAIDGRELCVCVCVCVCVCMCVCVKGRAPASVLGTDTSLVD
jgi:hypothetical protein